MGAIHTILSLFRLITDGMVTDYKQSTTAVLWTCFLQITQIERTLVWVPINFTFSFPAGNYYLKFSCTKLLLNLGRLLLLSTLGVCWWWYFLCRVHYCRLCCRHCRHVLVLWGIRCTSHLCKKENALLTSTVSIQFWFLYHALSIT
jgi:hypothetical protein